MSHTINFEDLFDWEVESDRHYYKMIANHQEWEEFEKEVKPTKIEVNHENIDATRKVRGITKKRTKPRLSLLIKALRTKSRTK